MPAKTKESKPEGKPDRTCANCARVFDYPSGLKRHQEKQNSPCFVGEAPAPPPVEPDATPVAAGADAKSAPKKKKKAKRGMTDAERLQKELELRDIQLALANDKLAQMRVQD